MADKKVAGAKTKAQANAANKNSIIGKPGFKPKKAKKDPPKAKRKANPQVTAFDSKLKIGRDVVKTSKKTGVKTKAESNAAKKNSIIGKPGSTGKSSSKTEKIVIQKKASKVRTKGEAKEARISARQATRAANKTSRQEMRKKNRAEKDPTKRLANKTANQKSNAAARVKMRAKKKQINKSVKK